MHDTATQSGRRQVWLLRCACMLQLAAVAVPFTFDQVLMRDRGLDEFQIGAATAVIMLCTLVAGLGWGVLADRIGRPDRLVFAGGFALAGCYFGATFCRIPLHFYAYAVARGTCTPLVLHLMPLVAVRALEGRRGGRSYSAYRIFGSSGYLLALLVLPSITGDVPWLFRASALLSVVSSLPLLGFRAADAPQAERAPLLPVLRQPRLAWTFVAVFFFALAAPAVFGFQCVYARELGASTRFIGVLSASLGVVAVLALPVAGRLIDARGPATLLLLAFIAQPLRALTVSFVGRYELLLLPQLFHMLTWTGIELGAVFYVTRLAAEGRKATALSVLRGAMTVGMMVGYALSGRLARDAGFPVMYRRVAALSAVGLVVFVAMLRLTRQRRAA